MSPHDWETYPIRELCSSIIDCVNKTAPVVEGPTPYRMIRTTNVRNGRVDTGNVRYVDESTYRTWVRRGEPRAGDIVLTREAPLGEVGMLRDPTGIFLGQRLVMYRADPTRADRNFLLYAMRGTAIQNQIKSYGSGSTVEHMRVPDCGELLVRCPGVEEQRRIGTFLASLDELIEINERRIEILEGLAKSLYREWFVRFRFPGHDATDSARTAVPEGWTIRPASDAFLLNPKIRSVQSVYTKVTMADVDERRSYAFPSTAVARAAGSRFQRDDVLLARITPCLENGKTALVKYLPETEMGVGSTEFIVLRGRRVGPAFVYCAARSEAIRGHAIKSMSGSSGRQRVAATSFDSLELVEPPPPIARHFEDVAGAMLEEVFALAQLNRRLATTRDLLLPRLVTGRLDISDIDLGDLLEPEAA